VVNMYRKTCLVTLSGRSAVKACLFLSAALSIAFGAFGQDSGQHRSTEGNAVHAVHVGDRANYESCLKGAPCNHALLSHSQYAKLHQLEVENNFQSCLKGNPCNHALLTKSQAAQIRQAESDRTKHEHSIHRH
jgi:hypothetical protein